MTLPSDPAFKSYLKSTAFCASIAALALCAVVLAEWWLPDAAAHAVAALSVLIGLAATTLTLAGLVVMKRGARSARGEPDLYLQLNESRQLLAISRSTPVPRTWIRRWLSRQLVGHDLIVGDVVVVRPWAEIRTTLDEQGCLEGLPFMPEMLAMCGQRARVFRGMHRLFDYRKTRKMRHMDGAVLLAGSLCDGQAHGGCEAACYTIWKAAWLRRLAPGEDAESTKTPQGMPAAASLDVLHVGAQGSRYTCQLTQLNAASRAIGDWSPAILLSPLTSGNVAPAAFFVGWLTYLFNNLQHWRGGIAFPALGSLERERGAVELEEVRFKAGQCVVVKSEREIQATLDSRLAHRGLWLEADMLKHCGRRYLVKTEVRNLIDIVTGEMRSMKTAAYILSDVTFSGERQLFTAQHDPFFWRGAWLRPAQDSTPASPSHQG